MNIWTAYSPANNFGLRRLITAIELALMCVQILILAYHKPCEREDAYTQPLETLD